MRNRKYVQNDMLNREINPGDYVVLYSNIYQFVEHLTPTSTMGRIVLLHKSKTTKSVCKPCNDMCLVDKDAVLMYLLTI